ncbi:hypothetical protein QWZ13_05575 [Reinekea marina]|uniref:hypothetical protein n=1 Tax=Reinekea marina TaxID=1310421 RepID=UPI0025B51C82|nr:hypothetical protein [Reinekea marina]MDN3648375.1 hypothetical protein [Reinekea marina]
MSQNKALPRRFNHDSTTRLGDCVYCHLIDWRSAGKNDVGRFWRHDDCLEWLAR